MTEHIGEYRGYWIYFDHISYSCRGPGGRWLVGFRTERTLYNAIDKAIKARGEDG